MFGDQQLYFYAYSSNHRVTQDPLQIFIYTYIMIPLKKCKKFYLPFKQCFFSFCWFFSFLMPSDDYILRSHMFTMFFSMTNPFYKLWETKFMTVLFLLCNIRFKAYLFIYSVTSEFKGQLYIWMRYFLINNKKVR